MKKEHQRGWRRLDNTAKIFPVIANKNFSNVFRVSVTLTENVIPEFLQQALESVLRRQKVFSVRLRRGFFWYYFEKNKRRPMIERENTYPCKYIDPRSSQMFLFRVSYFGRRINLEVFHAVTDGLGAVNFLRELTRGYLSLVHSLNDSRPEREDVPQKVSFTEPEDSYLKNYRKMKNRSYSSSRAYCLRGERLPLGTESVIHGYLNTGQLKTACKRRGVSVTKYLTACLIWAVYHVYLEGKPSERMIGVNLPINLRAFFDSQTSANFFAVTGIDFLAKNSRHTFGEILEAVSRKMDEQIVREKLEERISYNVSNEKKWYVRIMPLFLKWAAVNVIFRRNDRAHTITLSNLGQITMEPEFEEYVEGFHFLIGVSARQPVKCGVCSYKNRVTVSFTSVFADTRLQDFFFEFLKEEGIDGETEGNGAVADVPDRGMYPEIPYDVKKWRRLRFLFYGILIALSAALVLVNWVTGLEVLWSGIAVAGIAYAALTVRYSILRHANLGGKIMVQTLGAQGLLVITDQLLSQGGWAVNYGIPSTILFADLAIVFLIVVNRMNWQSYLMYLITMTVFSFIPVILWACGWITRPELSIITVILTVLTLTVVVLMGDRRVKNELIRRFHL